MDSDGLVGTDPLAQVDFPAYVQRRSNVRADAELLGATDVQPDRFERPMEYDNPFSITPDCRAAVVYSEVPSRRVGNSIDRLRVMAKWYEWRSRHAH